MASVVSEPFHLRSKKANEDYLPGRLARQTFTDYDEKIDQFSQNFLNLKQAFDAGVNIQVALTSFRTEEKLDAMGLYPVPYSLLADNDIVIHS